MASGKQGKGEGEGFLPRKVRAYITLVRPFTLLAPFAGGIAGGLMGASFVRFRGFDLPTLIYGASTLVLLNAASNILNQVTDLEIDRINKPNRPIPQGLISPSEATAVSGLLYLLALFRAVVINLGFGLMVGLLVLITVGYSLPPLRFKKRLWLSNISIALARGMLGIVAAWAIFGPLTAVEPWAIGLVLFVYLIGSTTTKDLTDTEGDARFGMKTLPVVYGTQKAVALSAPFFLLAFLLLSVEVTLGMLRPESTYMTVLIVFSAIIIALMFKEGTKAIPNFENSPVWVMMYVQLMTMQLWFAAIYIEW